MADDLQISFRMPEARLNKLRAKIRRSGLPTNVWLRMVFLEAAGRPDLAAAALREHRDAEKERERRAEDA